VHALRPERGRRWNSRAPRRAFLAVVPAAAALAVAAAVVHGLVGSRPRAPQHEAAALKARAPATTVPAFGAAGGGAPRDVPHALRSALAPTPPRGRLTRYEASITVRVAGDGRLSRATNRATTVARSLGGYAASVEYRSPAGRPAVAYLELRVPTDRVQDALARLADLGTLLSQQVSVQDLQRELERETAQIAQLRREIRLLIDALRSPVLTPLQRIQLQLRLGEAKRALAQRTHARGATIAEGTLARISLVLTAEKASVIAPDHRGRLGRLLHDAVSFLGLEATIALYALIVVAPFLVLGGLVWWAATARRRREERRLLSAAA
jgi:hypothetical protein